MDQKLNCNVTQVLEKSSTIGILSYTDSWCLVPFSSNVSGDSTHKVVLCFGSQESTVTKLRNVILCNRVHSKNISIRSLHKYISCNSKAWQSEWGFSYSNVFMNLRQMNTSMSSHSKPSRFFRRKGKARHELLDIKKTDEVEKTTGWREKCYLWGAYVYDWVKWLGHESDHKPLYNVDIMSGAIILSLYVSVLRI
jgi:hypothetical protein